MKMMILNLMNKSICRGSGASLNLFRYAAMVLVLLLGVSSAAGNDSYKGKITASVKTGRGLIYNTKTSTAPAMSQYKKSIDDTSDDSNAAQNCTFNIYAQAERGSRFVEWEAGDNKVTIGNTTGANTTASIMANVNKSTVEGTVKATFETVSSYNITYKVPQNDGAYKVEYSYVTLPATIGNNTAFIVHTDEQQAALSSSSAADAVVATYATDGVKLTITENTAKFLGWWVNDEFHAGPSYTTLTYNPGEAATIEPRFQYTKKNIDMVFKAVEKDYNGISKGSYTVSGQPVQDDDYLYNTGNESSYTPTLSATPATNYKFNGWYTKEGMKKTFVSTANPWTPTLDDEITLFADFVYNAYESSTYATFEVGGVEFTDLNAAINATNSTNKVITLVKNGILPPGNYTIPTDRTLLIPYNTDKTMITTESQFENMAVSTYSEVSAFRKLTFVPGASLTINGTLYVAGQHLTNTQPLLKSSGGPGRPVGPVGQIDMSQGGQIEVNGKLYCFGFITGQNMYEGNNTIDVGTVTANSGATVYENFIMGDMKGGTATLGMYGGRGQYKTFPINSYFIQNIEVPLTINYGAVEKCVVSMYPGETNCTTCFTFISASDAMFLLNGAGASITKWYDAVTDHFCIKLSGNSTLSNLQFTVTMKAYGFTVSVDINSAEFILPLPSTMHIILDDCNVTLGNELCLLPGAIVEIKNGSAVTLNTNMYLYAANQWGPYCFSKNFRVYNAPFTAHKERNIDDASDFDDAQLIVDGTMTITGSGRVYATSNGADVRGNGGGKIVFQGEVPTSSATIYQVTDAGGTSTSYLARYSYQVAFGAGKDFDCYMTKLPDMPVSNLHNENGSYTKSASTTTFYNVYGRWFAGAAKDADGTNHTHTFTYLSSGNTGTNTNTKAVYSTDKTGLELSWKWENVQADACDNWWVGKTDGHYYNWTINDEWTQFILTDGGLYSGSDNNLYAKESCEWTNMGSVDEDCLYDISGVRKAVVDGSLVALTKNNPDDHAWHNTANANEYYICFEGCSWHAATKYANAEEAYMVGEDYYIWKDGGWFNAIPEDPFFYTINEKNTKDYYEYYEGQWVDASPRLRVYNSAKSNTYYSLQDALDYAGTLKDATVELLHDLNCGNVSSKYTTSIASNTCVLDLKGNTITGTANKVLEIDASGSTFTITSSVAGGKLLMTGKPNNTCYYNVYLTKGTLILSNNATIEVNNTDAYVGENYALCAVGTASGTTFTMNGGAISALVHRRAYGIESKGTTNINGGTITCRTTNYAYPWGVQVKAGTTTIKTATITCSAGTTYSYPVNVNGGTAIIKSGKFHASAVSAGGAVSVNKSSGTLSIEGGYYTHNTNLEANLASNRGVYAITSGSLYDDGYYYEVDQAYTLSWVTDGNALTGSYTSGKMRVGASITAPNTPTKTGYTFAGWHNGTSVVTPASTMPTAALTYTAQWTPNSYSITYKDQGNADFSGTHADGYPTSHTYGTATTLKTATKTGYDFGGWFANKECTGEAVTSLGATAYTAGITLYAKWTEKTYAVTFNNGGHGTVQVAGAEVANGATASVNHFTTKSLAVTSSTGYTFAGWSTTGSVTLGSTSDASTNITATAAGGSVTATWTANNYSITYKDQGNADFSGTHADGYPTSHTYGTATTLKTATKTGYDFGGWFANKECTGEAVTSLGATAYAAGITLYAKWTPRDDTHYTVKHLQQNVENDEYTLFESEDKTGTTEASTTATAKSYTGFTAQTFAQAIIAGDGKTVVNIYYNRISYTVTWKDMTLSPQTLQEQSLRYGATIPAFDYQKQADEQFAYIMREPRWKCSGENVTAQTTVNGDMELRAQYDAIPLTLVVNDEKTISDNVTLNSTTVRVSGALRVAPSASLTTTDLILEAQANTSGEITGNVQLNPGGHAYFDLYINDTEPRHWHAFSVPFQIDLRKSGHPVQINGETLTLGRGYDIVFYDGAVRAAQGKVTDCWKYVEDPSSIGGGDSILYPGKAYMIASASRTIEVVRFTKADEAPLAYSGTINVTGGSGDNGGWNGIGNPTTYHAIMEAGPTVAQVHDGGKIGADGYIEYDIDDLKYVVGKAVYVQARSDKSVVISPASTQDVIKPAVPARRNARADINKEYLSLSDYYKVSIAQENSTNTCNVYVLDEEDKEDAYVIGHDLSKFGLNTALLQMWVNRYDNQLSLNTTAPIDGVAYYPLGINAPQSCEYTISLQSSIDDEHSLYLTCDGEAIWNLSEGAFLLYLDKGTTSRFGLRLVEKAPQVATGMDEAVLDAQGETQKILINDHVYIIRGNNVYTIDGQLVK